MKNYPFPPPSIPMYAILKKDSSLGENNNNNKKKNIQVRGRPSVTADSGA